LRQNIVWYIRYFIKVWAPKTSLASPLFIEVPVPIQEGELSCICVLEVVMVCLANIGMVFGISHCEPYRVVFCHALRIK
jgi:hypothetical protein